MSLNEKLFETTSYTYDENGNETVSKRYNRVLTDSQIQSEISEAKSGAAAASDSSVTAVETYTATYDEMGNAESEKTAVYGVTTLVQGCIRLYLGRLIGVLLSLTPMIQEIRNIFN